MNLRKARFEDWKTLLEWRNDETTLNQSINREIINEQTHQNWLSSVLKDENRQLYLAEMDDDLIGTVRADYDTETDSYELSWTIAPAFRGRKLGYPIVKLLVEKLNGRITAKIRKNNTASIKIAESVGMSLKSESDTLLHFANF